MYGFVKVLLLASTLLALRCGLLVVESAAAHARATEIVLSGLDSAECRDAVGQLAKDGRWWISTLESEPSWFGRANSFSLSASPLAAAPHPWAFRSEVPEAACARGRSEVRAVLVEGEKPGLALRPVRGKKEDAS